jgi:hypothetical protein
VPAKDTELPLGDGSAGRRRPASLGGSSILGPLQDMMDEVSGIGHCWHQALQYVVCASVTASFRCDLKVGTILTYSASRSNGILPRIHLDSQASTKDKKLSDIRQADAEGEISIQELAKHSEKSSLWVAVDGDVWE